MLVAKVDDSSFQAGLRDVRRAGRNLPEVFRRLRAPMRRDQVDHARQEEGPEGSWPARRGERAVVRRGKRRRSRARSIRLLGRLPDAIDIRAAGVTVFARSRVKWARAHADGDVVGRGARLPARSFLWISDELADEANRQLGDHLGKAWGGLPRATVIRGA
jgi:phage gpG-like protein